MIWRSQLTPYPSKSCQRTNHWLLHTLGLNPALIDLLLSMQTSSRLYHCYRCHAQVIICSKCDRGNRYCTNQCAKKARRTSQARATKKYQQSRAGRFNNAARQQRFRQKKKQKVTHQSSLRIVLNDVLNRQQPARKKVIAPAKHSANMVCHQCGEVCSPFLRHDFLRGTVFKGRLRC